MFKQLLSLLVLFSFFIIGFLHNSMMAFAMQNNMHEQMMQEMGMTCVNEQEGNSNSSCCISNLSDLKIISINNNSYEIKILKIKIINFIDIFAESSRFLEYKNLIKKTSPPNYKNKIKNYSYSDLTKIIKSTI